VRINCICHHWYKFLTYHHSHFCYDCTVLFHCVWIHCAWCDVQGMYSEVLTWNVLSSSWLLMYLLPRMVWSQNRNLSPLFWLVFLEHLWLLDSPHRYMPIFYPSMYSQRRVGSFSFLTLNGKNISHRKKIRIMDSLSWARILQHTLTQHTQAGS
jgi:hypothetical protein